MKPYLGICLLLVTLAAIAYFAVYEVVHAADAAVEGVKQMFTSVLQVQPQISVNKRVVMTQTAPIAELAVVEKEELITLKFTENYQVLSYTVPLTEKQLTAQAQYRIKAGFDLRQPFTVDLDPKTGTVTASMPHAQILSVEQIGDVTLNGTDEVFNRLTDAERANIINGLNTEAHTAANASSLKGDAEKQVGQRLQDLAKHNGQNVSITWVVPPSQVIITPPSQ